MIESKGYFGMGCGNSKSAAVTSNGTASTTADKPNEMNNNESMKEASLSAPKNQEGNGTSQSAVTEGIDKMRAVI